MIGTMNIPTDSPKEYYASRRRFFTEPSQSTETNDDSFCIQNNNNNNVTIKTQKIPKIKLQRPTSNSIFSRRKCKPKITYLSDGRKLSNGQILFPESASTMWRQLIVRTFVHKMEDEIEDPVEQIAKLHVSLPKLSREKSISTYSLVSDNRVLNECDKCATEKVLTKWQQIASLSKSSATLYDDSDSVFCSNSSTSSSSSNETSPPTSKGNQYLTPPNLKVNPVKKSRFSLP
uniref:Uncharacterized protein n=1 Tax=Panagrolaimus sp. PS1159 TaxID=55785 RepID=A0AC35FZV9_9BILA